jgi:class 3 adenylate cyclase
LTQAPRARARFDLADLPSLPLFQGVDPTLLEQISAPEHVRHYQDGEIIMHDDGGAEALVVLLRGQARIQAGAVLLAVREPYAVLGEQAIINETTRSATAIAVGFVEALVLPRHLVGEFMRDVRFVRNLLCAVSDKLREAKNERAYHYQIEQALFTEFRAHLSDHVVQRLLATDTEYGRPRYIEGVVLFSDIRSFTQRSAGMRPEDIGAQLTAYFDAVVPIIHRHEGLIDKFIGDAVMALWGYAPSESDFAAEAFACAQEMVRTAREMTFGGEPIRIGVGLNAGRIFIGNVGGGAKRQFTALGTPVNLAARYESASKELDAPIVLGPAFVERLPACLRAGLAAHENRDIKGAERQTLYSYDPLAEVPTGEVGK